MYHWIILGFLIFLMSHENLSQANKNDKFIGVEGLKESLFFTQQERDFLDIQRAKLLISIPSAEKQSAEAISLRPKSPKAVIQGVPDDSMNTRKRPINQREH